MGKKGFSLIEVLIAVLILLVAVLSAVALILKSELATHQAKEETLAALIIQSQFSLLAAAHAAYQQYWLADNALNFVKPLQEPDKWLCRSWMVSATEIALDPQLFRVTMNLQMIDGRQEDYVTYITPR